MTTTPSIRTDWPGPPPHRHRHAAPPRWSGTRRLVLGLVALLAGVLALNGVIQAAGSPSRTSSSGRDVDISSLLPPAAAAETPAGTPAEPVAVADAPTPVARSSESRRAPATTPRQPAAQPAPRAVPRAGAVAVSGSPATTSRAGAESPPSEQVASNEAERQDDADEGTSDEGRSADNAQRADDDQPLLTTTPKSTRDQANRTGRAGLLPGLRCAVDRVGIGGSLLGDSGCG